MFLNKIRTTRLLGSSILVSVLFLIVLPSSNSFAQEKSKYSIKKLLLEEIERHPNSGAEDVYKFIHQAAFGSEHAVKDTVAVRKWMENEIASLDYSITDQLVDHLSPDGKLVRINLRPFLKKGYDPKILSDAFIKTANNYKVQLKNLSYIGKWQEN